MSALVTKQIQINFNLCQRSTKLDTGENGKGRFESVITTLTADLGKRVQRELNSSLICTEVNGCFKGKIKE